MRQDWIEFKGRLLSDGQYNFLLRPEYVVAIDGKEGKAMTEIQYDTGSDQLTYYATEPYEQVKQKIMDAEKVELSDVVVEHFTREEYKLLLRLCENVTQPNDGYTPDWVKLNPIMNKLNKILKEEE